MDPSKKAYAEDLASRGWSPESIVKATGISLTHAQLLASNAEMNVKTSERATASSAPPSNFRMRVVTDEDMQKALDFLRDNAIAIGAAREDMIRTGRMLDHTEALLIKASDASSEQKRKADARTDQRWLDAALAEAKAAGEFEKMKALREAASAKIGAWQTESANYRGLRV